MTAFTLEKITKNEFLQPQMGALPGAFVTHVVRAITNPKAYD
jgi:hypothetical protein